MTGNWWKLLKFSLKTLLQSHSLRRVQHIFHEFVFTLHFLNNFRHRRKRNRGMKYWKRISIRHFAFNVIHSDVIWRLQEAKTVCSWMFMRQKLFVNHCRLWYFSMVVATWWVSKFFLYLLHFFNVQTIYF